MQTRGKRPCRIGFIFNLILLIIFSFMSVREVPADTGDLGPSASHSVPTINTYQFTGAATASIPISVPPGRNGLAPKLALTYNSYRKNGWVGVGWDLDLGAIQRSTKRGVDYTADDFVAMSGGSSSELVPRPDWGADYYGAKIEGGFTKYLYKGAGGWEVTTKDGTRYYYGQDQDSQGHNSRQDDPNDSSRVFKWCLDRVEDTNGNYMTAYYTKDQGQIYLKKIEYTGYDGTNPLLPSNSIIFYLEESRPDRPKMYNTNFKVVTAKLLKTIEVRTLNNTVVRTYKLDYTFDNSSFQSSLAAVQQSVTFDEFGMPSNAPRVTSFTWQSGGDGSFDTQDTTDMTNSLTIRYPGDYDGDGKLDILCVRDSDGYAYVKFSQGDGSFHTGPAADMTSSYTIRYPGDYNGDGKTDILCVRYDDGHAFVRFSQGNGTFYTLAPTDMTSSFTNRYPGDYNGDGKTDILCVRNSDGHAYVRFSRGDGIFDTLATTDMTTTLKIRYPGDYNGDGKTDVLCVRNSDGYAYVRFSRGDGTFDTLATTEMTTTFNYRYPGDYNGDGKTDILCLRNIDGHVFVRFASGQIPNLLESVTNDMGGTTTFGYKHSSDYQNELLPFIVHPVSSITVDDGNSETENATYTYDYSGGYFDFITREFRGFQTVTQTNPNLTIAKTKFHQGAYTKGRQEWSGVWPPNADPDTDQELSKTTFSWSAEPIEPTEDHWEFIRLDSKETVYYDGETVFTREDYTYDLSNGNLISKILSGTDAQSITTSYAYGDPECYARPTRETLQNQAGEMVREILMGYAPGTCNLISKEFVLDTGSNTVTKLKYDAYGNQTESWDAESSHMYPNNPTIRTEFDPATNIYPVRITNPLGQFVEYEYDHRYGKVKTEWDLNNNGTFYEFDHFGRVTFVNTPDGGQVETVYHDDVFPRYVVSRVKEDTAGNTIDAYEYFDGLGRSMQTISRGEGNKTIVTKAYFDNMGRNYRTEGPFFSTVIGWPIATPSDTPYTETTFDLRGRPIEVESPLGQDVEQGSLAVTKFSYSGLSVTVEDPDGGKKTEIKDYLGRVVQVTEYSDAGELYTSYEYNAAGDLLKVTDAMGNETHISYDSLGRKISMNDPDMGYWQYTYDANGNLKTQTDAKGQTITFAYDALNRVTSKSYSTLDPEVTYTYDETSVQNGVGRLYRVENSNSSTEIDGYDKMGREVSVTRRITGAPLSEYITRYEYDLAGRMESIIYPGATPYQVNYAYHQGTTLLHTLIGITDLTEYAELSDYEPSGKIGDIYHGNQTETVYTYDAKSTRLLTMQTTDPNMGILQDNTYRYTSAGDIKTITKANGSGSITYTYEYDKLHRLVGESNTGGADSFDPSMLIKTYDDFAPIHAVKSVSFNGMDHPYEYDENGNMIRGWDFTDPSNPVERLIEYDADNMPVEIQNERSGGTVTIGLKYDGEGVRVRKTINGGNSIFYIGDHFEVAGGEEIKYIFAGSLRIAKVTTTEKQFYHKDHLGSTTVVTDYSNGSPEESAEYLPFGLMRKQSGTEVTYYKFSDQEIDGEVGLYNFNARLYDPAIGTFISPDSIVPDPFDPQMLNRFSYARNNPLYYVDPSGHHPVAIGMVIGAAIGAITAGIQNDWNADSVAAGAAFGLVSGLVGHGVAGFVGNSIAGAVAGAATTVGVNSQLNAAVQNSGDGTSHIGAPGFGESLIPIWGSLRSGISDFQQGRYIWGTVNTLIAATDVFLAKSIVTAVVKISARAALTTGFKVAPKKTVKVFRVEGAGNQRLITGASGKISIEGEQTLFLNFGDKARAMQFLERRLDQGFSDTTVKSFNVPRPFLDDIASRAVPENMARHFPNAPLRVDVIKATNQFGLRKHQIDALQKILNR